MENYVDNTQKRQGEIVVFYSAKGGVGKTTLLVNTAVSLASKGYSTIVIDGSLQFGDVNIALDLRPRLTLSDLIQDSRSLNKDIIQDYTQRHSSGVDVLSAPIKPEFAELIKPEHFKNLIAVLLTAYDYVLIDSNRDLSDINLTFIEMATRLIVVSDLDMASLKNTKMMLDTLILLGLSDKIKLLINKSDINGIVKVGDVKSVLKIDDFICVAYNGKLVPKSFNIGIPFVISNKREKVAKDIELLVGNLLPASNSQQSVKNSGIKGLLRR